MAIDWVKIPSLQNQEGAKDSQKMLFQSTLFPNQTLPFLFCILPTAYIFSFGEVFHAAFASSPHLWRSLTSTGFKP